jgi:dTDP-4-amino-4,6-dideoxygalactose transaminase
MPIWPDQDRVNWSYFPIKIKPNFQVSRDTLFDELKRQGISGRRYFYPLISEFPMYRGLPSATPSSLPMAIKASREVICLPQYPNLSDEDIYKVCDVIEDMSKAMPLAA